jgi:acetyl esterase/lipase
LSDTSRHGTANVAVRSDLTSERSEGVLAGHGLAERGIYKRLDSMAVMDSAGAVGSSRMRAWVMAGSALVMAAALTLGGGDAAAASIAHVSYGKSPYQTIAVYPAATKTAPLVILVHGGGWESSPNGSFLPKEAQDLQAAGFAVFDVNYDTLSHPAGAFPLEINDVVSATVWAIEHGAAFGADPGNVEMIGGSAGGQLAMMATEELDAWSPNTVKSMVTLSGAFDFVLKIKDIEEGIVHGYDASHSQEALGCRVKNGTCTVPLETRWSPAEQATGANCPKDSLIINSSHESEPVDQANSMASALKKHGCAETEDIRNAHLHSFAYWNSVKSLVIGFVASH